MSGNELINKGLEELKSLGGEIEKAVKGASDEAKEGWKKLQPRLKEAEKLASEKASGLAQEVGESAGEFIVDVKGKLEELRTRIRSERSEATE